MSSSGILQSATTAIRSGDLLACHYAPRRARVAPAVVSVRTWGAAMRVRAVAAEGAGKGKLNKRAVSGITKPKPISPELREFVGGAEELPRTETIKLVWVHIKGNNLQDPNDKKIIVCDDKLKKIFGGRDRVGFLEISGRLNPHFLK